jgi:Prokaryotic E2 family E
MDLLTEQLAEVQRRQPNARFETTAEGHRVLVVPEIPLGKGWNREDAIIQIIVPAGYPHVHPDCFYTDADLRLAPGTDPTNSSLQAVFGAQYRWFSWHLGGWNPTKGTLDQYVRFCERRLREAR